MCIPKCMFSAETSNNNWGFLDKPVYTVEDLMEITKSSRKTIWRIQKLGFLRKLPGKTSVHVPRMEVVRYLESASGS